MRLSYDPKTDSLYIHLLDYPMGKLLLPGYAGKVRYAQFLHDASELRFGKPLANVTWQEELADHDLLLDLPVTRPDCEIPVIELFLHD